MRSTRLLCTAHAKATGGGEDAAASQDGPFKVKVSAPRAFGHRRGVIGGGLSAV